MTFSKTPSEQPNSPHSPPMLDDTHSQSVPRWTDPALFPELRQAPNWGLFMNGMPVSLLLGEIIKRIREGPGAEQWNGSTERPEVIFVTRPENSRPVAAVECPELQPAILQRDEEKLTKTRNKNGLVFYPLLLLTLVLDLGLHTFALLPAVFALSSGSSHIEAWIALNKLKTNPEKYLRDIAAQLRYSAWLEISSVKHRCRTCWIVIIWAVIGCVQMFTPGPTAQNADSGYLAAAALVKSAVAHEPWRLLTAPMLHGSIFHFLMNATAMFSLGLLLERGAHRHLLTFIWLTGALAGSLLSWAATPATSVGASGGILAVFCFVLVMGQRRKAILPPDFGKSLIRSLVIIGMLGLVAWGVIDNAAHLGGALVGAAIGYWVFRERDGVLPLPDSMVLSAVGRTADVLFVAVALFTVAKLLSFA